MSYKSIRSEALNILKAKTLKEDMDMGIPNLSLTPMSGVITRDNESKEDDPDHGGTMAKVELRAMADMASQLEAMMQDNQELAPWVQSKLAMAKQDLAGVYNYLKYKK